MTDQAPALDHNFLSVIQTLMCNRFTVANLLVILVPLGPALKVAACFY